ncbi:substrate-binding periplasmic protein [Thiomicrorhabdus sediminis]|uniref:Amino acid ABC transporter substrate-binding protein n=1 Tax=Thiomicrorhabdus sediminis TaxID=2580412 RepID=A0A4P9K6N7_9GAMM|nr:transporter substrate-binding domain-containing protein [Thiomicrorhabdus sediminis]QCU90531.1 amino acid ABC transporter substrate-binding protein [Thiomicrorhabdus sediminis]
MPTRIVFYCLTSLLFLGFSNQAFAQTLAKDENSQPMQNKTVTLYISSGFTAPISDYYQRILQEIDRRMPHINIEFEVLTAERSIDLVNRGINDGECCRIPEVVTKSYQNLISVEESFFEATFAAFSKKPGLKINNFEDLKPYSVATVVGWKILVNNLNRVNPREKYILSSPEQLMKMLKKGRIEVALLGYESGIKALQDVGLPNAHAYLTPPLAVKKLSLILHKKNQAYSKPLAETIKAMKADGTVAKIYYQVFKVEPTF